MEAEIQPCEIERPYDVLAPATQTLPLVFASPHSGRHYPPAFVAASKLDRLSLRRSEDGFVDEIFAEAPELGAPLLRANFPRAYVDANREPFELDPRMFVDPLPAYANTRSPRVAAGLGTIARVVANGADIYRDKLSFSEALRRIRTYYWPYHATLRQLLDQTKARFGGAILVDCHSMPSIGGPMDRDAGHRRVDFVLGDCHGTACNAEVTAAVEDALTALGYHVTRNTPYSGGFVTRHYGRPETGVHALQIEVNRALYMDERNVKRGQGLSTLARDVHAVVDALATLDPAKL
jgi:N-formylglutamate amidohydrolase